MAASVVAFVTFMTFSHLLGSSLGASQGFPGATRCFGVQVLPKGEKITLTGHVYDEDDYRRIRFVGRQKEVNENFAIGLIAEQPECKVESPVISCNGGGGALGHPKVYINLDKD
ncbi:NADH dehydrogenase [ubiquinone] iron-sulfur protein 6, mitochondrial-like [Gracilinanus agilis]|uniref:NADH dehydrogenase [ubiquinone] iron-sulfur protein 6, mitochondrial-like n=1 Tax=Gracilinanus agilis TaxID=191870 RepID=UPI001CFE01EF|nr:NADH dehydrogenase [ubiquinone] iron-sulfur protein 6, mitochondrial-like [Gracilinanus agilis]